MTEEWKQHNLDMFRALVFTTLPGAEEAVKWSVPVFIVDGKLICAISSFKDHTKFNFFNGALLKDENKLFNSGLDSKKSRGIDLKQGETIDMPKLAALLTEAASLV